MLTRKLRLTIDVTYQEAETCQQALRDLLHQAAEHLRDEGLLSGTTPAWVVEATHKVEEVGKWKTVPEKDVRLVYKCPDCGTEYTVPVEEATIPFCTKDGCVNEEDEADLERVEVKT